MRYSRHILLPEIGIEGQQKLLDAHALIVGVGGLGSPAAMYLAASGVGRLTLCDDDTVELTNLQRQIAHHTNSIGLTKVVSAQHTLTEINPEVCVNPLQERLGDKRMEELVVQSDVVLDCSDNFATRYALNRACFRHHIPLVSGAATRFEGQASIFDFRRFDGPCYNCLYPEDTEGEETRCAIMGVFAPLVGIIGSLQAAEAIKLIIGTSDNLYGQLLVINSLTMQFRTIKLIKDNSCKVCTIPGLMC